MSASSTSSHADILLEPNQAGITRATQLLNDGKLVLLPTETVYGIAVNLASRVARDAARALKQHSTPDAAKVRWVIHVGHVDDLLTWVPGISALGRRVITKSLPGPVAFEVKLDEAGEVAARKRLGEAADESISEGRIILRCPDFAVTQEVLAAVKVPVAIVGAGTAAQPAVYEAGEMPAELATGETRVEAILNGGSTRYRKASTLVRIDGDAISVTRAGVIDERILQRMADMTILFVCSGNTCRSPMASVLAAKHLADRLGLKASELPLRHVVVQSAGLHTSKGLRATLEAVDAVKSMGADLSTHQSQPVTADLLRRADVVYTMTDTHLDEVMELYPWAARKTFRLDPDGDVADPIGSSEAVYRRVAGRLSKVLQERLKELPI